MRSKSIAQRFSLGIFCTKICASTLLVKQKMASIKKSLCSVIKLLKIKNGLIYREYINPFKTII
jgi:hypothetical protein